MGVTNSEDKTFVTILSKIEHLCMSDLDVPTIAELERYEKMTPGAADIILTMSKRRNDYTMIVRKRILLLLNLILVAGILLGIMSGIILFNLL